MTTAYPHAPFQLNERATFKVSVVGPPFPRRVKTKLGFQRRAIYRSPKECEPTFEA